MISREKYLLYFFEFLNCYAAIYYSNFIFFYLRRSFGFNEAQNLLTAAAGGFVYIIAAWLGGKAAQKYGYIRFLYLGLCVMIVSLLAGMSCSTAASQVIVYCLWTIGVCLIWPALEAQISERAGKALPKLVGIYNITWAAGGAVAYFTAGVLIEKLGILSLFWLPLGIMTVELAILPFVSKCRKKEADDSGHSPSISSPENPQDTKQFLMMAWIANPFSYVAINTVIPLIPSLAEDLGLSTAQAGIACSVWMFVRLAAFAVLGHWSGWHYRFSWLAGAFGLMIISFFGFLSASSVGALLCAEVGFGLAIGLIYYSSLYYAMNVTENHGANAGLHEAMIGVGLFAGPAAAAAAVCLAPAAAGIGAWSVGGLLCLGFSGMVFINRRRKREKSGGPVTR